MFSLGRSSHINLLLFFCSIISIIFYYSDNHKMIGSLILCFFLLDIFYIFFIVDILLKREAKLAIKTFGWQDYWFDIAFKIIGFCFWKSCLKCFIIIEIFVRKLTISIISDNFSLFRENNWYKSYDWNILLIESFLGKLINSIIIKVLLYHFFCG
jgi:hypothetical protein